MQSLNWYVNRLRTMTPREVAWRVSDAARDGLDRGRFAMRLYPRDLFKPDCHLSPSSRFVTRPRERRASP